MKKLSFIAIFLYASLGYSASTSASPAKGDYHITLFNHVNMRFSPDLYPKNFTDPDTAGIMRLTNGRIIIKKVSLPEFKKNVKISLKITLTSNGDPWDKSGSCFVLSKSAINLLTIARDGLKYPSVDSTKYEKLVGDVPGQDYLPNVELMRFMTPFGVGYFSNNDDSLSSLRRPVYIPKWESQVCWQQDITDLYPTLKGDTYIGIFVDTWTAKGYVVSAELNIKESQIRGDKMKRSHVEPLVNTMYYMGQAFPDIFARKDLSVPFVLPKGAKNIRLKYIVTGHGGHDGGDEFTKQKNILSIDGKQVYSFVPWRDDCASFRRFNPSTGVWLENRLTAYIGDKGYTKKMIEEPIASSDLSRSNWCPGSDVTPVEVALDNLNPGNHQFTISIPKAQAIQGDKTNHWLVSAYLVWDY